MGKVHRLSELVEIVDTASSNAALECYVNSAEHRKFKRLGSLMEECKERRRNLLAGELSPELDLCYSAELFVDVLTLSPRATFLACELPLKPEDEDNTSDDSWDDFYDGEEINDETFKQLSKLPANELREKLIADYRCSSCECYKDHKADDAAQEDYHKAICNYFEVAAQLAVKIKSESARLWMEALRLISDAREEDFGYLALDRDRVAEAYRMAERAHRILWVDNRLHRIPKFGKRTQPLRPATAGCTRQDVPVGRGGQDIASQFGPTRGKGRRGSGLKGTKTKRMVEQLKKFKEWINNGHETDERYPEKTVGARAKLFWNQNVKTMEKAAKASGEQRGYSCDKTLADAYRKSK